MGEQLVSPASSDSIPLVGRFAEGPTRAVDTQGDLVYFGTGEYFTVADISDPANLVEEGRVLLPAQARDVQVVGNYAYVAAALGGLRIIDVSDPTDPRIVSGFGTPAVLSGNAVSDVAVSGSYLYYASGYEGMLIVDISDPTAPKFINSFDTGSYTHGVAVADGYAYVTAGTRIGSDSGGGLQVIDVSDPSALAEVASVDTGTYTQGRSTELIIRDTRAFVSGGFDGLRILDISTPTNPEEIGSFNPSGLGEVRGFDVNESYAYVRDRVLDVSDPTAPQEVAIFNTKSKDFSVSGVHGYATTGTGSLRVINVSDPENPTHVGFFPANSFAHDITISGSYAYAASGNLAGVGIHGGGLRIIDISDPKNPEESSFLEIESIIGDVIKKGKYAYIGNKVIDVSDKNNPKVISELPNKISRVVHAKEGFLYRMSFNDLIIIDVSNPLDPEIASRTEIEDDDRRSLATGAIDIYGDIAYVSGDEEKVSIVDISNPYSPEVKEELSYGGSSVAEIKASGGYLYFSDRFTGVFLFDISEPSNPSRVSKIFPLNFNLINGIDIAGGYAYLADGYGGLRVVDVSDPANPKRVAVSDLTFTSLENVIVNDGYSFTQSSSSRVSQKGGMYIFEFIEDNPTPPPTITGVDPDSIIGSEDSQTLVVEGTNYRPESSVKLINMERGEVFPDQKVTEQTDTSLTINYAFGTEPAKWAVEIINPGADNSGEFEFEVLAPGTGETPAPPTDLTASTGNGAIQLAWEASTSDYVEETLLYRSTSASQEDAAILDTLKGDATSYTDTIEAGTRYYYRLRVRNAAGNMSPFSPAASTFFKPTTITYDVSRDFGGADEMTDYRLVALPGQISRPFSEVVNGEAGTEWQAFWDDGTTENYLVKYDGSSSFTFRPGRGFWMLKKSNWSVSQSIETVSLNDQGKTSIPIHEGWNIIANPFGKHISWGRVGEQYSDSFRALWRFDGSFVQADTFRSARIGEAFYFLNDTGLDSLQVPYPGAPTSSVESKEEESLLTITARPEGSEGPASMVEVGFAEKAAESPDRFDQPAPPGRFSAVTLRLKAPGEVPGRQRWLATEWRPPTAGADGGHTFDLRLRSQVEGPVQINASGFKAVEGSEVELLHPSTGRTYDLKSGEPLTLQETDSTALRLAVGTDVYVQNQADKVIPEEVTLTSYPNPMRKQATLEYTLPEVKEVRLTVYDMLGRRVATLEQGQKKAGRHQARLEGDQLSSGVYFGRLEVGDQTRTHKITVVR